MLILDLVDRTHTISSIEKGKISTIQSKAHFCSVMLSLELAILVKFYCKFQLEDQLEH